MGWNETLKVIKKCCLYLNFKLSFSYCHCFNKIIQDNLCLANKMAFHQIKSWFGHLAKQKQSLHHKYIVVSLKNLRHLLWEHPLFLKHLLLFCKKNELFWKSNVFNVTCIKICSNAIFSYPLLIRQKSYPISV